MQLDLVAVYRKHGASQSWPLRANDPDDLEAKLTAGGHFLALPKEPAALANILEVSLVDFLLEAVGRRRGAHAQRGTERGYPDLELSGSAFGAGFHAVDVKVARRNAARTQTQSRITLYTGNTFFRYPSLHWPGTFRPFEAYASHVDVLGIYTLDESSLGRISDLELIVQEPWSIASKQRSSTTREYMGAVTHLDALRQGLRRVPRPGSLLQVLARVPVQDRQDSAAAARQSAGGAEESAVSQAQAACCRPVSSGATAPSSRRLVSTPSAT